MPRRMPDEVDLAGASGITHFAGHEVSSRDGTRIADRKRRVKNRTFARAPDVDDAVSLDRSDRSRVLENELESPAARVFRIVVVDAAVCRRRFAVTGAAEREWGA